MEQSEEWLSGRRYLDLAGRPAGTGEGQLRAG
jgi:hypothetical protein